jgi:hypothetical protein
VAAFLSTVPRAEVVVGQGDVDRPDEPAFSAAIPTRALGRLPCVRAAA